MTHYHGGQILLRSEVVRQFDEFDRGYAAVDRRFPEESKKIPAHQDHSLLNEGRGALPELAACVVMPPYNEGILSQADELFSNKMTETQDVVQKAPRRSRRNPPFRNRAGRFPAARIRAH